MPSVSMPKATADQHGRLQRELAFAAQPGIGDARHNEPDEEHGGTRRRSEHEGETRQHVREVVGKERKEPRIRIAGARHRLAEHALQRI